MKKVIFQIPGKKTIDEMWVQTDYTVFQMMEAWAQKKRILPNNVVLFQAFRDERCTDPYPMGECVLSAGVGSTVYIRSG